MSFRFLVDVSGSGSFSSVEKSKNEIAAQVFALLAFASAHNNDNIGLILFSDQIEYTIKPRKGKKHVLYMIHKILEHEPKSKKTDLKLALEHLNLVRRGRCVAFVLSDFLDQGYEKALGEVARLHDLVCIAFSDKRERELPASGILEIVDAETGHFRTIDCSDASMRRVFSEQAVIRDKQLREQCRDINADYLSLCTSDDYLHKIISFFRARSDRSADAK